MKEGYRDWSRKDMRILVAAIERNGRKEKVGRGHRDYRDSATY